VHCTEQHSQWRHVGVAGWEVYVKHKQPSLVRRVLRAADDAAHLRDGRAGIYHLCCAMGLLPRFKSSIDWMP
jgi:hypothetical protein